MMGPIAVVGFIALVTAAVWLLMLGLAKAASRTPPTPPKRDLDELDRMILESLAYEERRAAERAAVERELWERGIG